MVKQSIILPNNNFISEQGDQERRKRLRQDVRQCLCLEQHVQIGYARGCMWRRGFALQQDFQIYRRHRSGLLDRLAKVDQVVLGKQESDGRGAFWDYWWSRFGMYIIRDSNFIFYTWNNVNPFRRCWKLWFSGYVAKCAKNLSPSQVENYESEEHLERFHDQDGSTVWHELDESAPLWAFEKHRRKHRRGWENAPQNRLDSNPYRQCESICGGNVVIQKSC